MRVTCVKIINYNNQVTQGTLTDASETELKDDITKRMSQTKNQLKITRDGLQTLEQIPVAPGYESQMRQQEHAALFRQHQQQSNKFLESSERFEKAFFLQQDKKRVRQQRLAAQMDQEQSAQAQ